MNTEIQFFFGAGFIGLASLALSVIALVRYRNQQLELELGNAHIEDLEDMLIETKQLVEEYRATASEHSRRIAWLDAKVRQSRFVSVAARKPTRTPLRSNSKIAENRLRVLELANRGQNINLIAADLGMMPGEVELILNLNSHTTVAA